MAEVFARTGIQFLQFNTLDQLAAHAGEGLPARATRLLLIPDLLHFFLCGKAVTEYTTATTSAQHCDAARWLGAAPGAQRARSRRGCVVLEPNDAAVSKYARMEPRDREWIRPGLRAGVLSLETLAVRLSGTTFLDAGESVRARGALEEDRRWLRGSRSRTG